MSARLARENPRAVVVLSRTAGRFDEPLMRELNRRFEVDREDLARVARVGLVRAGLAPAAGTPGPSAGEDAGPGDAGGAARPVPDEAEGWWDYLWSRRAALGSMTLRHLLLAGGSLLAAVLLAVPLGLLLERRRESAEGVIRAGWAFSRPCRASRSWPS